MSTADVGKRNWLQRFNAYLSERRAALRPNQKAYANAALFFLIYWLMKPFDWEIRDGVLFLALLSWGMAIASDLLAFHKRFAESVLGKLVLLIVVGGGTNVAIAMAAQVVNDLVGIDPSRFVHTIAFVSMHTAVVLILLAMSLLSFVGLGLALPYLMLNWANDEQSLASLFPWYKAADAIPYKRLTVTVQVASFLALGLIAYSWVKDDKPFEDFVKGNAQWFLYNFEMFDKAPCALSKGQRVAFLEGGEVLVADPVGDGIAFRVQPCVAE